MQQKFNTLKFSLNPAIESDSSDAVNQVVIPIEVYRYSDSLMLAKYCFYLL